MYLQILMSAKRTYISAARIAITLLVPTPAAVFLVFVLGLMRKLVMVHILNITLSFLYYIYTRSELALLAHSFYTYM